MTIQEDAPGLPRFEDARRKPPARARLNPIHDAAMRLADVGFSRSRTKTRDLVGLLLCHGARAWRGAQPHATLRIRVIDPAGRNAVRLRLR